MGVIGAGISINGPSGIDTASLVDQLTALEQQKVTAITDKVTNYKTQISAYGKLQSALATIQTAAKALNTSASFDLFKSESSDSDIATLTGGPGALEGSYDIRVAQLAASEKMISKDKLISSQTASLSSIGIHVGDISIDGTKITIDTDDTIQDVRMKINNATDSNGKKLNVSASVIQASANNYRLVLTAKTSGSQGIAYRDVTGSTLEDLGIIGGVSGVATQVVTTNSPIESAFNALKEGATVQFNGTDHSGNAVTGTFTKTSGTQSINNFTAYLNSKFGPNIAAIDAGGNLVLTDSASGASKLNLSSLTMTDSTETPEVFSTAASGSASVAQVVTSQNPIVADFNNLSAGSTVTYTLTDHSGATVTNTYTKASATTDISDFLGQLETEFNVTASIDAGSDNLVVTDLQPGVSSLAISAFTMTDADTLASQTNTFSLTTAGAASVTQVVASQNPLDADFNNLNVGSIIEYTGTNHNGNAVTGAFTKTSATTLNDFIAQLGPAFGAAALIDGGGNLVLTDSQSGASSLAITAFTLTNAAAGASTSFLASVSTSGNSGTFAKGNATQSLASSDSIQAAFTGLSTGSTIGFAGADHNGSAVAGTFTKTAGSTINDFLQSIQQAFLDTVDVSIDSGSGSLIVTDKTAGTSRLALTSFSTTDAATSTTTPHTVGVTTTGKEGAGVMTVGRDAFFSLDGIGMTSSDNSVENVIGGTTIELHKASAGETVQTTLVRDTDAIKANVQKLVDAYNALVTLADDETKMADPGDSSSKGGDLAGDTTVKSIVSRIRAQFMQPSAFTSESYNSLTMIGIKTDAATGQMSIDDTQFSKAITNNFDEVEHLFVTAGVASNSTIAFGRKTTDTQSGTYVLRETDTGGHDNANYLSVQLAGNTANPWYTSDTRNGDIVTFSSGPLKGLSLTSPSGTIGPGNTASFTFSIGMGDALSDLINSMTDPTSGIIAEHDNSLNDQIKEANSRADEMQTRVNDYHDRLVKQFAAMEQAMNTMKSQMSNMLSALGSTTTSG